MNIIDVYLDFLHRWKKSKYTSVIYRMLHHYLIFAVYIKLCLLFLFIIAITAAATTTETWANYLLLLDLHLQSTCYETTAE
jgi:hypothetical protein